MRHLLPLSKPRKAPGWSMASVRRPGAGCEGPGRRSRGFTPVHSASLHPLALPQLGAGTQTRTPCPAQCYALHVRHLSTKALYHGLSFTEETEAQRGGHLPKGHTTRKWQCRIRTQASVLLCLGLLPFRAISACPCRACLYFEDSIHRLCLKIL